MLSDIRLIIRHEIICPIIALFFGVGGGDEVGRAHPLNSVKSFLDIVD